MVGALDTARAEHEIPQLGLPASTPSLRATFACALVQYYALLLLKLARTRLGLRVTQIAAWPSPGAGEKAKPKATGAQLLSRLHIS